MHIRMMIVDDEPLTRKTLCECIPWNQLGVDQVMTASNGRVALKSFEHFAPDILICDVCMPKMDGITLAQNTRQLYPECCIIFISGYADKEYLKSAISLKAVRYIEKPISMDEIQELVRNCVYSIYNKRTDVQRHCDMLRMLDHSRMLVQQEILRRLYVDAKCAEQLRGQYGEAYFSWQDTGSYSACAFRFCGTGQPQAIRDELSSALEEYRKLLSLDFILGWLENDLLCVLLRLPSINNLWRVGVEEELMTALRSRFPQTLISMGVGNICTHLSNIDHALHRAVLASGQWFYSAWNSVHYDVPSAAFNLPNLSGMPPGKRIEVLRTTLDELHKTHACEPRQAYAWLSQIWNMAAEQPDFSPSMTLAQVGERTLRMLERRFLQEQMLVGISPRMQEICLHILANYRDSTLSVASIAEFAALSPNYLGSVFHKETGMTITRYILRVRIREACELLLHTDMTLYQISEAVGYDDVDYFSSLFMREMKAAPSVFRKNGGCRR